MASLADAFVRLRPDTSGFKGEAEKGINAAGLDTAGEVHGKKFGQGFARIAGAAIAGAVAAGAAKLIGDSVSAASDLNESVSKTKVVFGGSTAAVELFAATARSKLGISRQAALEAASTFGNFFEGMKIGQAPAAAMSTRLVTLASDLASFNNVDPTQVLEDLRSGLAGQVEPLRKYGIDLSDVTLRAEAMRLGLISHTQVLTANQKAQAAYSLILAQSGNATGDFARTSSGLANQQRILSASWLDAKAALGTALLPAMTRLASIAADLLPKVVDFVRHNGVLIGVVGGLTAAVWLLNIALDANPVVLIALAIVALVAGVIYAYTHFKTFRDIVNDTWHVIATSALWAWNNVLKPTVDALVVAYQAVATAALWLWHNVLDPVFHGIAAVVSWAWDNVIYPAFQALNAVIVNVIAPVVSWLWHNIVTPAMQAISIAFQIAAAIIRPILETIAWVITNVLAPVISWLWHNVVQPVFQGIGDTIKFVWNNVLKPVFDAFGNIINNYVAPAFRAGVAAIKSAWDGVKEVAKVPINFVIGFINAGIIHPYNAIAGFFGVKDRVQDIQKLAAGGKVRGPGGPRGDKVPAMLSDQEFVVNARDTAVALPILTWINGGGLRGLKSLRPKTRYPGDLSQGIPGFKDGGLVGWLGDVWDAVTNPGKFLREAADKLLSGIPGGQLLKDIITGGAHKAVGWLVDWVTGHGGGSGTPASLGAVSNLIRAQAGKPYIWSGAGPVGFDCSGLISMAYNALRGRPPYQHTFSTSDEGRYFPISGMGGLLTAGWSNPGEGGPGGGPNGVGHTAGWLGPGANGSSGLKFESVGGSGVRIGSSVTPISSFAHVGHFDQGGQLAPGWNLAYNGTGRGEPVGGPLELSDATIAALGRAIGREISGVGASTLRTARAR